jgi:hypothetical protein
MRLTRDVAWSLAAATLGLALSIGMELAAHNYVHLSLLRQAGAVVLGGLIALRACRRRGEGRRSSGGTRQAAATERTRSPTTALNSASRSRLQK